MIPTEGMSNERRRQIQQVFHAALQQEPEHREPFLAAACQDDEELRRQVRALLTESGPTFSVDKTDRAEADELEERTALMPGERLGPYHIVGPLGQGGMGKVYRPVDTRLDRAVAIKISAEEFSKRFEREARTISALNHPHICTLYDIGSLPSGSGYMVTELVEGETLRD
jgi:serine/threonine protein kinase